MSAPKLVRVDALRTDDPFWLPQETLGLEPDDYIYVGNPELAQWEYRGSVFVTSRHGERFVIPRNTLVKPL